MGSKLQDSITDEKDSRNENQCNFPALLLAEIFLFALSVTDIHGVHKLTNSGSYQWVMLHKIRSRMKGFTSYLKTR